MEYRVELTRYDGVQSVQVVTGSHLTCDALTCGRCPRAALSVKSLPRAWQAAGPYQSSPGKACDSA